MSNEYEVKITVDKANYAYAIEKTLQDAGWHSTGSGQNMVTGERDLWMIPPEGCDEAVPDPIPASTLILSNDQPGAEAEKGMTMKIKQSGLDRLFSQYIRLRDGYTCRYSGERDGLMDCAHIFSRRHRWTRWHPDNAVCLSRRWHMYFTEHPHEWADWTRQLHGNELIDTLQQLSRSSKKMTDGDKHVIMCDLIKRIEDMGEKPCFQGGTRKAKKKQSKYKRKVSGEVVLRRPGKASRNIPKSRLR